MILNSFDKIFSVNADVYRYFWIKKPSNQNKIQLKLSR